MVLSRQLLNLQTLWRIANQRCFTTTTPNLMAGHSKWANIRHIKAQKDGEKAALFTRISRQIRISIQEGGSPDPAINSSLRSVIDEALRKNMPMASIQGTIKKCQQTKTELKKHILEMRYRQKVFVVCSLFTDNFALFKQELATILRKNGAMYTDVSHLFDHFGVIEATWEDAGTNLEERVMEDAIECGAEDVEVVNKETGVVNFFCSSHELNGVRGAVEKKGYKIDNANQIFSPKNTVTLTEDELKAYQTFVSKLESMTGVEDIFDNVENEEA